MDFANILGKIKNKTKVAIVTALVLAFYDQLTFLHAYEPTQIIAAIVAIFGWADYQDGVNAKAKMEAALASSELVSK